jgi:predicted GIY-YIG superfamily endonuclease
MPGISKTPENSIKDITKVMQYEPLLFAVISKKEITTKLKKCVGRYFNYALVDNDEIKYIGYTGSLYYRMVQHKPKQFDKVLIMEFDTKEIARANERFMIKSLLPESNYQFC